MFEQVWNTAIGTQNTLVFNTENNKFTFVFTTVFFNIALADNLFIWSRTTNTFCDKLQWTLDRFKTSLTVSWVPAKCYTSFYNEFNDTDQGDYCYKDSAYYVRKIYTWAPFPQAKSWYYKNTCDDLTKVPATVWPTLDDLKKQWTDIPGGNPAHPATPAVHKSVPDNN